MVWGAISSKGPVALARCDDQIVNSEFYCNILE